MENQNAINILWCLPHQCLQFKRGKSTSGFQIVQLVFLSKPARSFMGNKDQVGVFHLKGWLKLKSGGRYQEGRGMYKSSATRSVDETREMVEGLAKNMVLVTFTTDAQSFNTLLDSTIPSELKNYVQDIVRTGTMHLRLRVSVSRKSEVPLDGGLRKFKQQLERGRTPMVRSTSQ